MAVKLDKIFDSVNKNYIFKDKFVLQTNYTPETIPHRDKEIEQIAAILAPALKGEKTSNLFVYGKTGCISGDSLVYTNNGWKKIKEADSLKEYILSFNTLAKQYEWSNFVFLRFTNKDKLLKITLDNGYEIIVTKDHPLLLFDMGWKKSNELKLNDEVVLGYDLPNINKKEAPLRLARFLGFIIADGSLNKRERRIKDSRGNWYNSNKQRCRFFSEEDELLNLVREDLYNFFNCTPQIICPKNRCRYVNVVSQQVCQRLYECGIPFGKKSSIVEVPKVILESSNIVQREFLKALFSCDGTVSQQTYQIEYYSNSKTLLQQISYLLYQEGIVCKIRPKIAKCNGKLFDSFRLYLNGQENLVKFYNKIGFYSISKQEKLKKMLGEYAKNMGFYDKNYQTSKIIKIEETYEGFVYDLTVPKNHNFIANGIISHNTGKTLSIQYVKNELLKRVKNNNEGVLLRIEYLNCKLKKVADTEYRILAELIKKLGGKVPATGLPTESVYNKFIDLIDKEKQLLILVLDEVDQAVKKISDNFLYNLTRLNSELSKTQISLVGISNDLRFLDNLDPRVRSSLSEEEIVFPPYNALQLQDILRNRAEQAFHKTVVDSGVIEKCAAFAAHEHGDARRALDLLRVAGEIAERQGDKEIKLKHIDSANSKIERDKILDVIESEPKQFQLTLLAILNLVDRNKKIFTGNVYEAYHDLCKKTNTEVLTQRRVSSIISEFDMLGLIQASNISRGTYGKTREIKSAIPKGIEDQAKSILREALFV